MAKGEVRACLLCQKVGLLCDSHLLPKATYRLIRKSSARSPVILTPELISATDLQVHQDLLCEMCEQRFSKAESYALSQCCRGKGFRLQEILETLAPLPGATEPHAPRAIKCPIFQKEEGPWTEIPRFGIDYPARTRLQRASSARLGRISLAFKPMGALSSP